jgi:hypothetical protein
MELASKIVPPPKRRWPWYVAGIVIIAIVVTCFIASTPSPSPLEITYLHPTSTGQMFSISNRTGRHIQLRQFGIEVSTDSGWVPLSTPRSGPDLLAHLETRAQIRTSVTITRPWRATAVVTAPAIGMASLRERVRAFWVGMHQPATVRSQMPNPLDFTRTVWTPVECHSATIAPTNEPTR